MEFQIKKSKVTLILVGINVVVFLGLTMIGMTENAAFMLGKGALYTPYVVENQEYYRMFTSIFLHFGIEHLGNNMLLLVLMGGQLEQELGTVKYIVLYFAAGLAGSVLTILEDLHTANYAVSAGASGAIFGTIGGMLWVVIRNRGRVGTLTSQGIVFMIGLSLYYGFTSTGIGNAAHIGGLIMGFLLTILLYRKRNDKSSSLA
ncbi:MAG: rhomboid family intramembrane serine protease [Eubacteriales bacterium]